MKIIAIANYKGGVAKSTTALELGWYLAERNVNVLMIDADPQANLTTYLLNDNEKVGRSLSDILISETPISGNDINTRIIDSYGHHIDFVATSFNLSRIERNISSDVPKEYIIADSLTEVASDYDVVIIDTAPSAELLGLCSLIAADEVIIPATLDKLCLSGISDLTQMFKRIQSSHHLNPNLHLAAIIVTRYRRTLSTQLHAKTLFEKYGELIVEPFVRESTKVQQAGNRNMSVIGYDPYCSSAKDYQAALEKIIRKLKIL